MTTSNIFDLADTWSDAAVTFTSIKMNVTDTASAAASNLLDLQVGGGSRFSVRKSGFVQITGQNNSQAIGINAPGTGFGNFFGSLGFYQGGTLVALVASNSVRMQLNTGSFSWGSQQDLELFRDAADNLAQRRGTNAQAFNIYNTFTNTTNYERARMGWVGNVFEIKPQAEGTGTVRELSLLSPSWRVVAGKIQVRGQGGGAFEAHWGSFNQYVVSRLHCPGGVSTVEKNSVGVINWSNNSVNLTTMDAGIKRAAAGKLQITNGSTGTGELIFVVPTTDPAISGALWNNAGTLSISAG